MEYYVYVHRRNNDDKIIYAGCGQGDRAYDCNSRNSSWKDAVNAHGRSVEILHGGMDENTALLLEAYLIDACNGKGYLTNSQRGQVNRCLVYGLNICNGLIALNTSDAAVRGYHPNALKTSIDNTYTLNGKYRGNGTYNLTKWYRVINNTSYNHLKSLYFECITNMDVVYGCDIWKNTFKDEIDSRVLDSFFDNAEYRRLYNTIIPSIANHLSIPY